MLTLADELPPQLWTSINALAAEQGVSLIMTPLVDVERVYGVRVKRTATHYIDVLDRLPSGFWLVATRRNCPAVWDRYWGYTGRSPDLLGVVISAAVRWSGREGTDPQGWNRNPQTDEWREP